MLPDAGGRVVVPAQLLLPASHPLGCMSSLRSPGGGLSDEWARLLDIWQSTYKLSPLTPSPPPLPRPLVQRCLLLFPPSVCSGGGGVTGNRLS